MKSSTINLLQRIQPLMDAVDLDEIPQDLVASITRIEDKTGITTPDYAKRLLALSNEGAINDDEYVGLVFHFSELSPLITGSELNKSSMCH